MLEENNLSGTPKLKQSGKVRNHNRYYISARTPATITRAPSGNLILKHTAADGSVKQEIVGRNKDAPLVEVVHISPRASNVVYEHALKRDRTPFAVEQNIGFHLAKIGYC